MHSENRRRFLKHLSAGLILSRAGHVAARPQDTNSQESEALAGSPRWPSSYRKRDFYNRGSSLDEIVEISARIPDGDAQAYLREWGAIVDRTRAEAGRLEEEGRKATAANAYLRAANYANRLYNYYLRLGDRNRGREAYRRVHGLFSRGIELAQPYVPFERVTIPYGEQVLNGFFFKTDPCDSRKLPVVYRTGGADSIKESSFFTSVWAPYLERGVHCLVLDAPGQGEALNLANMMLPPDFEKVIGAVVDYLVGRPDVDPARIGIYGTSMGGYFAGRGAAFENRVAAVVMQSAWYDVLEDSYNFCPSFRPHLRYMVGARDHAAAVERLKDYNFRSVAEKITVPVMIAHGEGDDIIRFTSGRRLFDEIASTQKFFRPVSGVRHNLDPVVTELIDWLCGRLTAGL